MTRIPSIDPETATGRAQELLEATSAQLGRTPNLYRAMAASPAALEGYLAFRGALVKGVLSQQMREQVALLVATLNDCDYCVAAHTFRVGKIGLSETDLRSTKRGQSDDPKIRAALQFAVALVDKRGRVSDDDFMAVKGAGWTDEEAGELVGHVALNVFSNYFNHVARPEIDFPAAPSRG
jgi:uncharacterized peroxidase-related enzyme